MGSDALYHNFVGFTRVQPPRGYLPHLLVCSWLVFMSSQCFIIGIPCSQVKVNVYWLWITSEHIHLCDQVLESAGDELPRPPWSHNNPRYQEPQAMSSGGMDQAGLLYLNILYIQSLKKNSHLCMTHIIFRRNRHRWLIRMSLFSTCDT